MQIGAHSSSYVSKVSKTLLVLLSTWTYRIELFDLNGLVKPTRLTTTAVSSHNATLSLNVFARVFVCVCACVCTFSIARWCNIPCLHCEWCLRTMTLTPPSVASFVASARDVTATSSLARKLPLRRRCTSLVLFVFDIFISIQYCTLNESQCTVLFQLFILMPLITCLSIFEEKNVAKRPTYVHCA